jgi:nitronate monooxygenase/enoyl-[acyl-carrier protein] reductase II
VGSVEEAKAAADAGVDAVIAQGSEAGGHIKSTTPIWEIVPATVEAVKPLPVLASGGIGDGKGIAKAIRLGAQSVSLGTRFVASEEAWLHQVYKERVVKSTAEDTVYAEDLFDVGWPNAPPPSDPEQSRRGMGSGRAASSGRAAGGRDHDRHVPVSVG